MKQLFGNFAHNSALKFYGVLFAVAFGLNWIWENGQMFAYRAEANGSPLTSFLFCTLAAVGDAVVTTGIYGFLKLLIEPGGAKFYLSAAASGAACAVGFEWLAFRFDLWSYGEQMIVLPILGVGLLPFVQLALLVPAAIWLARKSRNFELIN